jgi:hypothetical protein
MKNELIKLYKELRSKSNFVEDDLIEFCLNNDIHPSLANELGNTEGLCSSEIIFLQHVVGNLDYSEELNEDNFVFPENEDYVSCNEEEEEYDIAKERPGLWENIRRKKERMGDKYRPAKPGDPDRPDKDAFKRSQSSEYQGRKVTLNKPFRTPGGPKKFSVYVKNDKGNVVKVNFGDPNMKIKKSNPERRKSFRARHNCDNPGPKWKSRYWACRSW